MGNLTIKHLRAFVLRGGGADYHDQGDGHWIDDHISTCRQLRLRHLTQADCLINTIGVN